MQCKMEDVSDRVNNNHDELDDNDRFDENIINIMQLQVVPADIHDDSDDEARDCYDFENIMNDNDDIFEENNLKYSNENKKRKK